ncbi:hypothetical protein HAX54_049857, partial [Datura stramonium]|nr:hypothetical protein [Datura stramonium]
SNMNSTAIILRPTEPLEIKFPYRLPYTCIGITDLQRLLMCSRYSYRSLEGLDTVTGV